LVARRFGSSHVKISRRRACIALAVMRQEVVTVHSD
jgi:hypothetical protein